VTYQALLSQILQAQLPCYMMPDTFVMLEKLPLTANGKVDLEALPNPDFLKLERTYVAPKTALEFAVCSVWQTVLQVPEVGVTDDFFKLGGDSILSIHVAAKLREQGIQCSVLSIFEHRTIEELVNHVVTDEVHFNQDKITSAVDMSDELLERLTARYQSEYIVEDVE